jgi:phosphohistidine swiveling domain-containing protein
LSLVTGYGEMAETDVVADLWAVSRDRLTLEQFVARHGYHGPQEGELSSAIWRIDPTPLNGLVAAYREMDDSRDPRQVERTRGEERARAEAELFGALSTAQRGPAKVMARLAATFIPLRGVGKAAFLQSVDAARASARALGELMAERGELDEPTDVFMLTVEELLEPRLEDRRAIAAERRSVRDEYRGLDVPDLFNGVPVPFPAADPTSGGGAGTVVTGTPVSPGVVEGIARLIVDSPGADETLEPGEILVCRTTDPGWASVMMLALALVIDIGGPISHGAIVARELGIPCVIGTRDGTAQIRTGDRLRVDGAKGEVEIMAACGRIEISQREISGAPSTDNQHVESNEPIGEASMSEFLVLRALRLKGRADAAGLASATGLPESETASIAAKLVEGGDAREVREAFMLLPTGRDRLNTMLDEERAGVDQTALHEAYEEFVAVNGDFKQLASDWQLRDGVPNEHNDAAYDQTVLDRLPGIHERVSPVVARSVELAPRLSPYPGRFADALAKVQAGDTNWLLKPLIDSYHTVWFEYHEELIGLAGLSREAEAASGRAE